jgi:sterol desaturase/sphingolipid hydroxylase (fatty acid hydroxylase superfamily)
MQVARAAPTPAGESYRAAESHRSSRRLYLPTIVIAGLAAWLSYRGWTALAQTGVARSFDAGRYNLAGPVVLGLTHLGNHRLTALWRLHAVHHSQEELSILTTYRAHPLVHVSFLLSAVPVLAVAGNTTTPAAVLTAYACLGALPHANVRWTYGKLGRVFISPAYHRIHADRRPPRAEAVAPRRTRMPAGG